MGKKKGPPNYVFGETMVKALKRGKITDVNRRVYLKQRGNLDNSKESSDFIGIVDERLAKLGYPTTLPKGVAQNKGKRN